MQIEAPMAAWSTTDHLLAHVVDAARGANWQRGGGKGPRPKPVPRPGKDGTKRMGRARPIAETRDLFDKWRNGQLKAKEVDREHIHHRKGVTRHGH